MPDVVTFDPLTLRIIEVDAAGDNELDIVEIYSEWKEWVKIGDNAKHPSAFRFIGGDPLTATQNAGITYFLTNGWRIRPFESDHKLTIVGNLFTDPEGFSAFVFTLGTFTVNTETRVSNLVDSSVARLDLTQLLTEVFIDVGRGVAGTTAGIGTPTNPVNNVVDARTIADRDNLRAYAFVGSIDILAVSHIAWSFRGLSASEADVLTIGGANVTDSKFSDLSMAGTMLGHVEARGCSVNIVTGLEGNFHDCGFVSNFTIADNAHASFHNCYSHLAGDNSPSCTLGVSVDVNFRSYSGGIELQNCTAGCAVSVDLDPGHLIVNANCTGGEILVRGVGRLTNNSSLNIMNLGFLSADAISEAMLSVAFDGTSLEMVVWAQRRNQPLLSATSATINWYNSDGSLLFTQTSLAPDAQGHFELLRTQALGANEGYYAVVLVVDSEGTIENRVGVPTVGP